jgi:hypothetical protein
MASTYHTVGREFEADDVVESGPRIVSEIDAGLGSIVQLPNYSLFSSTVIDLNLHCNSLTSMEGIGALTLLVNLNLSSNLIEVMDASELWTCSRLQRVDLACNRIAEIDGLSSLRQLEYMNLAYNRIRSLEGLKQCSPEHKLRELDLRENFVGDLEELLDLNRCPTLERLVFATKQRSGRGAHRMNSVAQKRGYLHVVQKCLPRLAVLDEQPFAETLRTAGNGTLGNGKPGDEASDLLRFVRRMKAEEEKARCLQEKSDAVPEADGRDVVPRTSPQDSGPESNVVETTPSAETARTFVDEDGKPLRVKEISTPAIERATMIARKRLGKSPKRNGNQRPPLPSGEDASYGQNDLRLRRLETRLAIIQSTKARHRHMRRKAKEEKAKREQLAQEGRVAPDVEDKESAVVPASGTKSNPWRKDKKTRNPKVPGKRSKYADGPSAVGVQRQIPVQDVREDSGNSRSSKSDAGMSVQGHKVELDTNPKQQGSEQQPEGGGKLDADTVDLATVQAAATVVVDSSVGEKIAGLEKTIRKLELERDEFAGKLKKAEGGLQDKANEWESKLKSQAANFEENCRKQVNEMHVKVETQRREAEAELRANAALHADEMFRVTSDLRSWKMKCESQEQEMFVDKEMAESDLKLKLKRCEAERESMLVDLQTEAKREKAMLRSELEVEKVKILQRLTLETQRADTAEAALKEHQEAALQTSFGLKQSMAKQEGALSERLISLNAELGRVKDSLGEKIGALERQNTGLLQSLEQSKRDRGTDAERMNAAIENLKGELDVRKQMIMSINEGLVHAKAEATKTYEGFAGKNGRLKAALQKVQSAYEGSMKENATLRRSVTALQQNDEQAKSLVKDLKQVLEDQRTSIRRLKEEKMILKKESDSAIATAALKGKERRDETAAEFQKKLESAQSDFQKQVGQIKKLNAEKHVLMERIQSFTKFEEDMKEAQAKTRALHGRLSKSEEIIKCMEDEKSTIVRVKDAMLADKDDTIKDLKSTLKRAENDASNCRDRLEENEEDLAVAQDQLSSSLQIREELESIVENLRSELDADNVDGMRGELRKKERTLQKIESEMDSIRSHMSTFKNELKKEKDAVKKLKVLNETLSAQAKAAGSDRSRVDSLLTTAKAEAEKKDKTIFDLRCAVDRLTESEARASKDASLSRRNLGALQEKIKKQKLVAAQSLREVTNLYETMLEGGGGDGLGAGRSP